jgi:hypothetical protein
MVKLRDALAVAERALGCATERVGDITVTEHKANANRRAHGYMLLSVLSSVSLAIFSRASD